MTPELVLIRGLPGSGKSTMARTLALIGFRHFEADMFYELEGVPFNRQTLLHAHRWCAAQADAALESGVDVVVSNTFTRLDEMRDYVLMADAFGGTLRVIEATGDYGSTKPVPAEKITEMRERWEPLPCAPKDLAAYFTVNAAR